MLTLPVWAEEVLAGLTVFVFLAVVVAIYWSTRRNE